MGLPPHRHLYSEALHEQAQVKTYFADAIQSQDVSRRTGARYSCRQPVHPAQLTNNPRSFRLASWSLCEDSSFAESPFLLYPPPAIQAVNPPPVDVAVDLLPPPAQASPPPAVDSSLLGAASPPPTEASTPPAVAEPLPAVASLAPPPALENQASNIASGRGQGGAMSVS